jgi:hypothetical protein
LAQLRHLVLPTNAATSEYLQKASSFCATPAREPLAFRGKVSHSEPRASLSPNGSTNGNRRGDLVHIRQCIALDDSRSGNRQRHKRFGSRLRDVVHARNDVGVGYSNKGGRKVKTAIITLSAAILIATAPAVLARNVSSKAPHPHHQVAKKHPSNISWRVMHDNDVKPGYPGAYAPGAPKDYTYENSRNAGGGGGSGM